jgi:hypothetical protein
MDIIIALHCLNLALDHTRENIMLSKFNSLKFHNVLAFIPTEGILLIKLIPQVSQAPKIPMDLRNFEIKNGMKKG